LEEFSDNVVFNKNIKLEITSKKFQIEVWDFFKIKFLDCLIFISNKYLKIYIFIVFLNKKRASFFR
jgi:hypothetical protein